MKLFKWGIFILSVCIIICIGLLLNQRTQRDDLATMQSKRNATSNDVLACFLFSSVDTYLTPYYINNYDLSILLKPEDITIQEITQNSPYYDVTLTVHPHFIDETNGSYDKIQYQITDHGELIHKSHQHITD